MAEQDRWDVQ